ncbi:hypothetical protein BIY27_12430 [Gibbsiella quercinecans]|nr:hypothetical protein BIY27_12430 [Gibbsiella quercinecans]
MAIPQVRLKHYLAYGSGDFFGMGTTALTGAWLLFFYTNFCNLTAIEAASIFAIARVFDAVASPLMGFFTDNCNGSQSKSPGLAISAIFGSD